MQLGMIGLGRMGANMVRRLHAGRAQCVVLRRSPEGAATLAGKGASRRLLARGVRPEARKPRRLWLMVPAAFVDHVLEKLLPLLEAGDTVIDGGNSYYHDDIARAKRLAKRDPLRGHRHERRRLGAGARLLPDDRRRHGGRQAPRPDLPDARPGSRHDPEDARPREARQHRRAGLPPLRPRRRRPLRQDGPQRDRVRR